MEWENISTDPNKYNKDDFCFIVHGIILPGQVGELSEPAILERIAKIQNPKNFFSASLIGVPNGNPYLTNLKTYGTILLILDVPERNIYVAWPVDLGTPIDTEELREWAQANRGKLKSPELVLSEFRGIDVYNELVIKGGPEIKIKGVVYKSEKLKGTAEKVAKCAEKMLGQKIPIVYINGSGNEDKKQPNEDEQTKSLRATAERLRRDVAIMQSHREFREWPRSEGPTQKIKI